MTEVRVRQRSAEWFDLRQCVSLTASHFGDALGMGRGHSYDYFLSLLNQDPEKNNSESEFTRHGIAYEPVINEAYQLLTGNRTEETGLWLPRMDNILHNLVSASPDGKVMDPNSGECVGLAEYKAPVFKMYSDSDICPHGIPRQYMAQMQGQMAVCEKPWCDFMAICEKTKEITLKKVHFSPTYWQSAAMKIKHFCYTLQEARRRKQQGLDPLAFVSAEKLKASKKYKGSMSGENEIIVEDLIQRDIKGRYKVKNGMWMTFEFLVGSRALELPLELTFYAEKLLSQIDSDLRFEPGDYENPESDLDLINIDLYTEIC